VSQPALQPNPLPPAWAALELDELRILAPHTVHFNLPLGIPEVALEAGFERVYSTLAQELIRISAAHAFSLSTFAQSLSVSASSTGIRTVARRMRFRERLATCAFLEEVVGAAAALWHGESRDVDRFLVKTLGVDPYDLRAARVNEEVEIRQEIQERSTREGARLLWDALLEEARLDLREELTKKLRNFGWWETKKAQKGWLKKAVANDARRSWREQRYGERVWFRGTDIEEPETRGIGPDVDSVVEARHKGDKPEELTSTPEDDLLSGSVRRLTEGLVLTLPVRHRLMAVLIKERYEPMEAADRVAELAGGTSPKAMFVGFQNALIRRLLDLPLQEFLELLDAAGIPRSTLPSVIERMRRRVGD